MCDGSKCSQREFAAPGKSRIKQPFCLNSIQIQFCLNSLVFNIEVFQIKFFLKIKSLKKKKKKKKKKIVWKLASINWIKMWFQETIS